MKKTFNMENKPIKKAEVKQEVKPVDVEKQPETKQADVKLEGNALINQMLKDLVIELKEQSKDNAINGRPNRRQIALANKLQAYITRKVFV